MDVEEKRCIAALYVLERLYDLAFPYFHIGDVVVICQKFTYDQVEETISHLIDMHDVIYTPYGRGGSYAINR